MIHLANVAGWRETWDRFIKLIISFGMQSHASVDKKIENPMI
jgi:hypothetical protein